MSEVKFGFFSDLHYEYDKCGVNFQTAAARNSLISTLQQENMQFQYILIAGDICNRGKYTEDTIRFIHKIADKTNCEHNNIILSAGNHDVKRKVMRTNNINNINEQCKKSSYILDEDYYKFLTEDCFSDFYIAYKAITNEEPDKGIYSVKQMNGINFISINTSILADKDNKDNLYVCDSRLYEVRDKIENSDTAINIVMGHHGVSFFEKNEQNNFSNWLSDINADIYLCGHVHSIEIDNISNTNEVKQISCGGPFVDDYNKPSFIYGIIDTDKYTIDINLFEYTVLNNSWSPCMGAKKPYNKGHYNFTPKRHENNRNSSSQSLSVNISSQVESKINSISADFDRLKKNPYNSNINYLKKSIVNINLRTIQLCDKVYERLANNNPFIKELIKSYGMNSCNVDAWEEQEYIELAELVVKNYNDIFHKLINYVIQNDTQYVSLKSQAFMGKKRIVESSSEFRGYSLEIEKLYEHINQKGSYTYIIGRQFYGKTTLLTKYISSNYCEEVEEQLLPWLSNCIVLLGSQLKSRVSMMESFVKQVNLLITSEFPINEIQYTKDYFDNVINELSRSLDEIIIIIDALDELSLEDLSIFPEILPDNVKIVLSSKNKEPQFKKKLKCVSLLELKGFNENDFCDIVQWKKGDKGVNAFLKYILRQTSNNPYLLMMVANSIIEQGGQVPEKEEFVRTSLLDTFNTFQDDWKTDKKVNCPLNTILKLFVYFEPLASLNLNDIQSYLRSKEYKLSIEEIDELLNSVKQQLEVSDENSYRLKYHAFAEHVLDKYKKSKYDFIDNMKDIYEWLMKYEDKQKYIAFFYIMWSTDDKDMKKDFDIIIHDLDKKNLYFMLIIRLKEVEINKLLLKEYQSEIDELFDILQDKIDIINEYFNYLYNILDNDASRELAINYIEELSEHKQEQAIILYVKKLMHGDRYIKRDIDKALKYLVSIPESKEVLKAKFDIYNENQYLKNRNIEIKRIIEILIEEPMYKAFYASDLLTGERSEQNIPEGIKILEELIALNNVEAMYYLAKHIIDGIVKDYDISYALSLYDKMDQYTVDGQYYKGLYYCNNGKEKLGLKLIKESYNRGSNEALLYLVNQEIKSNIGSFDKKNELKMLAERGDVDAAYYYGRSILKGLIADMDQQEGIYWMNYAVENNNIAAIEYMIYFYKESKNYQSVFYYAEKYYSIYEDKDGLKDMCYLLRKGIVVNPSYDVKQLLLNLIEDSPNTLAIVNLALLKLSNNTNKEEWCNEINILTDKIDTNDGEFTDAIEWWYQLEKDADTEGDLVIGLLQYIKKLPVLWNEKTYNERLLNAKRHGWNVPDEFLCT